MFGYCIGWYGKGNEMWLKEIGVAYLAVVNLFGFAAMGLDKYRAKTHAWRIPEKTLFLLSIIGGCVGTWAGMYVFRHKTRHWYFVAGMPGILAAQAVVGVIVSRLV